MLILRNFVLWFYGEIFISYRSNRCFYFSLACAAFTAVENGTTVEKGTAVVGNSILLMYIACICLYFECKQVDTDYLWLPLINSVLHRFWAFKLVSIEQVWAGDDWRSFCGLVL